MSSDSERKYVKLIYHAANKYPNWDPETIVQAGDWGRIIAGSSGWLPWADRGGIFVKEGNIYQDGLAERYDIPKPTEYGAEASNVVTWFVSQNAKVLDVSRDAAGQEPGLADCRVTAGYRFPSSGGAVLAMQNDTILAIDPPGRLRELLEDDTMRDCVVVSEVHRCSSYARYLSSPRTKKIVIGLSEQSAKTTGDAEVQWVHSTTTGEFKADVSKDRDFCPLFKLVSLKEDDRSIDLRVPKPPSNIMAAFSLCWDFPFLQSYC
ncbi:hypothetical protein SCP_1000760 [Sparassis crispa]|uniref:Uncharacterized protein n=1 Tax=Sparassis crispa TaxID=139825 RepID=A0A401GYF5_9APHY|nr:hypothetical protein SCP_1000760 [Sparassis crispa]GBE86834.1 hypothetical protein SCP_1000760 [Sparassis crispa]